MLSVTLRDAQHLCWKNFRTINDKLDPERGKKWTPAVTVSDILTVSNNVRTGVNDLEDLSEQRSKMSEKLGKELSNLLYFVFVLAEYYKIELEDSFLQTVNDLILSSL